MRRLFFPGTALLLIAATLSASAAPATLAQQINPPEVGVGEEVTVTISVQNGSVGGFSLPAVDGLQVAGNMTSTNLNIVNGAVSSSVAQIFTLIPARAGNFTIPGFDLHTADGQVLHVQPMKLHVLNGGPTPPATAPTVSIMPPPGAQRGPVVMPQPQTQPNPTVPSDTTQETPSAPGTNLTVPVDKDGHPLKVFMVITPQTTDAYVGETVPMRIEFFIRYDVLAGQDALPTIKGSDFLINSLSTRPFQDDVTLGSQTPYHRETWLTALSAPRSGDFPLEMERDTYWTKPSVNAGNDPFGNLFFNRPQLVHGTVSSNQLVFHSRSLPTEGRPANFSGAIGQLKVTGNASPLSVAVGEPVKLSFAVSGAGNFDYVKCPILATDPNWKVYVPTSKIEYDDENHTHGVKTFEQSVIPQKNGTLSLPAATFSYFDPTTKQYVTTPIPLPPITVTGTPVAATTPSSGGNDVTSSSATPAALPSTELAPNRMEIGSLYSSLTPLYRQAWFWIVQGGLATGLLAATVLFFVHSRSVPDTTRTDRALRERSLHQQEDAMSDAVRRGDAQSFFLAARNAVQLQLGAQWRLQPEAITLAEIRERDPHLAEIMEPLFTQAGEVIYSGLASDNLNLAEWEVHVRRDLLQPQPA